MRLHYFSLVAVLAFVTVHTSFAADRPEVRLQPAAQQSQSATPQASATRQTPSASQQAQGTSQSSAKHVWSNEDLEVLQEQTPQQSASKHVWTNSELEVLLAKAPQQSSSKHVWTNGDLNVLHTQGLITTFGSADSGTVTGSPSTTSADKQITTAQNSATAPSVYPAKTQDPRWYVEQATKIQATLDERENSLREARAALARAKSGVTEPGIDMGKGNVGVTPESGIAILETEVDEARSALDDLGELARQNGLAPGLLRS